MDWYQVRKGQVSGETHYKAGLEDARVRNRSFDHGSSCGCYAEGHAVGRAEGRAEHQCDEDAENLNYVRLRSGDLRLPQAVFIVVEGERFEPPIPGEALADMCAHSEKRPRLPTETGSSKAGISQFGEPEAYPS